MKRKVAVPFHYAFDGKNATLLKAGAAYDFPPADAERFDKEGKLEPVGQAAKVPPSAKKAKQTIVSPTGAADVGIKGAPDPAAKKAD